MFEISKKSDCFLLILSPNGDRIYLIQLALNQPLKIELDARRYSDDTTNSNKKIYN